MSGDHWHDVISRTSIPLRLVDDKLLPIGSASACVTNYGGARFLLSAAHSVRRAGRWMVECQYVHGRGMQGYHPGPFGFLTLLNGGTGEVREVDLAYVRMPQDIPLREQLIQEDGTIVRDVARLVADIDFDSPPQSSMQYAFVGDVMPRLRDAHYLSSARQVFDRLTFCGEVEQGIFGFQLAGEHPGHEWVEGCSGSPILDDEGRTVSIVVRGDEADNLILGIDLRPYRRALDVELMPLLNVR